MRLIFSPIPVGMEGAGEIVKIEGDAMGLMGLGRRLDLARILGDELHKGDLTLILKKRKVGQGQSGR